LQAVAFCSRSEKPLCCVDGSGRRKLEMSLLRTRAGLAEEPAGRPVASPVRRGLEALRHAPDGRHYGNRLREF
jgi:hypothetical protein